MRLLEFTDSSASPRAGGQAVGRDEAEAGPRLRAGRHPTAAARRARRRGRSGVAPRAVEMVRELAGEGIGVLWSTAYLDEAEACDTVFLLSEGRCCTPDHRASCWRARDRVLRSSCRRRPHRAAAPRARRDETWTAPYRASHAAGPEAAPPHPRPLSLAPRLTVKRAAHPRFEDGFIDILGGGPPAPQPLAEAYRTIPATAAGHRGARPDQAVRRFHRGGGYQLRGPPRRDLRSARPEWRGQIHHLQDAVRSAHAERRHGSGGRIDLRRARADARQSLGYMAQKFSLYGDLAVQAEPRFLLRAYGLKGAAAPSAIER